MTMPTTIHPGDTLRRRNAPHDRLLVVTGADHAKGHVTCIEIMPDGKARPTMYRLQDVERTGSVNNILDQK